MADDKSSAGKGAPPGKPGKRPYATLDLKATEIKVTPIAQKADAAATNGGPNNAKPAAIEVPLPAPASSYATKPDARDQSKSEARMQAEPSKSEKVKAASSAASNASFAARTAGSDTDAKVVVEKHGGFFSHLTAGILGGVLAFLALQWALPELGLDGALSSRFTNDTAAISARIAGLEKRVTRNASAPDLNAVEDRVAGLEKTVQTIPALTDSQRRLVADTKAALASAASDSGSPQLIERLGKVEDKLKALADAGANDPNAGRVEQLAALTAKVTDLETSLSTQLSVLHAGVTKDVDSRIQAATAASETAQTGNRQLYQDVTGIRNDTTHIAADVAANKDATSRVAADLKATQQQTTELKTAFDSLKTETAKPADITAAVAPIAERTATLEKNVQDVMQDETARKKSAEQVVLALELQNLKRALDSGQKYSAQLDAVKKLAGNSVDLTALTNLQNTGVPSLADLKKDFLATADAAIDTDATPENAGVVQRLWSEAKSVVRVRRIDLKPDDKSTEATIGRMQVALNDGHLTDVLQAAKDLSPDAQTAAQPFLDKVEARVSIDSALAALESQLKSSIAPGSEPAAKSQP
jgi:hypothetical protein